MRSDIREWIRNNKEELIDMIQRMIQQPSTQRNELGIQRQVSEILNELQFQVDMWEPEVASLKKHQAFISTRDSFQGSPNVVGVKKGVGNGHSLVLNGHVDVVPEGDRKNWVDDPYSGVYKDGKVYGRGSTDMKGANAAMLFALKAIKECGVPLKGDIVFHSVIEEESGGAGTLEAILKGYTADAAIIPEPTQMKIFPKQQGSLWFRLYVKGVSAHGGTRYEGVSAIEKTQIVLDHIKELEQVRNDRIDDPLFSEIPIPIPINIGIIQGGDWPSSVADLVKVEGRYGVSPSETIEEAKAEFKQWMKKLAEKDIWFEKHPIEVEWFGARWLPGSIDTKHPLMNILTNSYEKISGAPPTVEASPWGTDGGLLTYVGNTPSVVFGPGVTSMAHYPNEYIEVDKALHFSEILANTIIDWCNKEKKL
ncbi:peptidase [Bacillus shivajii]|uniref:peptidase n=1 Tax=Bacillus shivajii TaxID=1983719 RepID=UPI001CFC10CF|nr:peptidase [Bacillus shivajii]UCZ54882.1 peptidase [Bacillus shivajii]